MDYDFKTYFGIPSDIHIYTKVTSFNKDQLLYINNVRKACKSFRMELMSYEDMYEQKSMVDLMMGSTYYIDYILDIVPDNNLPYSFKIKVIIFCILDVYQYMGEKHNYGQIYVNNCLFILDNLISSVNQIQE